MTTSDIVGPPSILDHNLNRHFPDLLRFNSTPEMEASSIYQSIRPEVERIMNAVAVQSPSLGLPASEPRAETGSVNALAWNLERGIQLDGIIDVLKDHPQLRNKDVLLLTELDYGMARSGNRFVAKEIADALHLNFAFAPVYIPLQKGSGVEAEMAGENTLSIHGLGTFSPHPITNAHAVALPNGKDKMWGKEKRLGWLRALVADIEHPAGTFRAVTLHLDAHSSRKHRHLQMRIVLDHLETLPPLPTIIGGDWNTTTFNIQTSTHAILGYFRRIAMGIRGVAKNHFPHPDRYFERAMFTDIEARGYEYRSLNEEGVGTLHYDMNSVQTNENLSDWVPAWCFPFLFWAAKQVGGKVSGRLDWFAGKEIALAAGTLPQTIGNLTGADGRPLSDHDAIAVEFQVSELPHISAKRAEEVKQ
ncbi:MAG: endonuclease/exonuclease/phosphatase family protein [Pyrinomonadaceae bacterium]